MIGRWRQREKIVMASPVRHLKDSKVIISTNQKNDEMLNAMENVKLTEESEKEMLRSRIDEQGQLICILKKRADEFMIRNQTLEGINSELEQLRQQAIDETKLELKRSEMLEQRFNELAENHEEMIKFKDEHKRKNEFLTKENARLLQENRSLFSGVIEEKDTAISNLRSSLQQMKKQHREEIEQNAGKLTDLLEKNTSLTDKVETLQREMKLLNRKLKSSEDSLSKTKAERDIARSHNDTASQEVRRENDALLEQVMQRGKLLQERQSDVERLQEELTCMEHQLKASEENFKKMEDRVNANSRVKKLQSERELAEEELMQLRREYDAYKAHSSKLLDQEKDLNFKLRKNIIS